MSYFDLTDRAGNCYRLTPGSRIPLDDSIAAHYARAEALLDQVEPLQLQEAREHFYTTGNFQLLRNWRRERLDNGRPPLCPREDLVQALCHSELAIVGIDSGGPAGGEERDRRGILRVEIRQALATIIAAERAEAARHERMLARESAGGRALIYTGAFFTGLWNAGADLAGWLKEVNDVVNPVQRQLRAMHSTYRALQRSRQGGESLLAVYTEEHLKAEKRELVEALGFDPTTITLEQLDRAMEAADLIWDDTALRADLTRFAGDYARAQHAIEITEISGGAAFEVLFTIILAAVTAGAGLAAGAASQARHMGRFRRAGDLLMEYAEQARKLRHTPRQAKNQAPERSFDQLPTDEIEISPETRSNNSANATVPERVPMTQKEYDRVINLEKGNRPEDVTEYLPEEYVEQHLSKFEENGGAFIVVEDWISNPEYDAFQKNGKFVGLSSEMDVIIEKYKSNGNDWTILRDELNLGENTDLSGSRISYIKLPPGDERFTYNMPTGNEGGAYEGEWTPGGFTKSGTREATLSGGENIVHKNDLDNLNEVERISVELLQ